LTSPGSLHNTLLVIKNIIFYPRWWKLFDGTLFTLGLSVAQFVLILFCILVLWAVSMMQERFSVREALEKQNIVFRWIIIYIAIFAIIIFGVYGLGYDASAFLYMQY
jgi:hypothetical protein